MTNVPFQFGGEHGYYKDEELDTYYVMARVYDPKLIRWLSIDPIPYQLRFNAYAYAHNNPLLNFDPFGLFPCEVSYEPCGAFGQVAQLKREHDELQPEPYNFEYSSNFTAHWFGDAACCNCAEVGFVQIWRGEVVFSVYNWLYGKNWGWSIDNSLVPYDKPGSLGKSKIAPMSRDRLSMTDSPGHPYYGLWGWSNSRVTFFEQDFETCVVCLDNLTGEGEVDFDDPIFNEVIVLGCLKWGHSRSDFGPDSSRYLTGKNSGGSTRDIGKTLSVEGDPGMVPSDIMKKLLCEYKERVYT